MPTHKDEWPSEHWEELISTIIDRIGVERFLEMATYVLEEKHGCAWVALAADMAGDTNGNPYKEGTPQHETFANRFSSAAQKRGDASRQTAGEEAAS